MIAFSGPTGHPYRFDQSCPVCRRSCGGSSDPEKAARDLIEIANSVEAVQDRRIQDLREVYSGRCGSVSLMIGRAPRIRSPTPRPSTLEDAANYITKLAKAERKLQEWQPRHFATAVLLITNNDKQVREIYVFAGVLVLEPAVSVCRCHRHPGEFAGQHVFVLVLAQ